MIATTPAPTHWFTLDWHELVTEVDIDAPHTKGDPLPMRQRHVHHARRVGATSYNAARRLRDWHLTNDTWIPAEATRDAGYEPNVSDIYQRHERRETQ